MKAESESFEGNKSAGGTGAMTDRIARIVPSGGNWK